MEVLHVDQAKQWMKLTTDKIQENKEQLTELDQAIGDGDHGINMSRGFKEVMKKLTTDEFDSVADVMKAVATTLMAKVGGAAGPLYGTAFLKLSMTFKGQQVDYQTFVKGMEEAVNGIKQRGKAEVGEKTLVDVWSPIIDRLKSEEQFNSTIILEIAKSAVENTKDVMATKGRAAYMKERSVGHIDPGSMSSFYLFEALAEVVKEGE